MSFELPTNTLSPADLEASNKTPIYVAVGVGFVLATGGVILRLAARRKSKAALGWDDYTIVLALFLLYALDITTILTTAKYGLGRHLPAVLNTVVIFQKIAIGNLTLWLSTAAATKASLLLLYYRLFSPSPRFRLAVYIGAVTVFCQWFSLALVTIFQCRPIAAFWNHAIRDAKCINLPLFTVVSGVMNLLTDVLILCLPIPMVWGLNTTKAQKVTLTGIFLLGIFVCAISIVRISKLAVVNYDDPTWRLVDVEVWTTLENSVGITSACLPTLRPLFGRFFRGASQADSNPKESRSDFQRAPNAQFNRLSEQSSRLASTPGVLNGSKDDWTGPHSAADNELSNMDQASSRPLRSLNSSLRREEYEGPYAGSRRADYG